MSSKKQKFLINYDEYYSLFQIYDLPIILWPPKVESRKKNENLKAQNIADEIGKTEQRRSIPEIAHSCMTFARTHIKLYTRLILKKWESNFFHALV